MNDSSLTGTLVFGFNNSFKYNISTRRRHSVVSICCTRLDRLGWMGWTWTAFLVGWRMFHHCMGSGGGNNVAFTMFCSCFRRMMLDYRAWWIIRVRYIIHNFGRLVMCFRWSHLYRAAMLRSLSVRYSRARLMWGKSSIFAASWSWSSVWCHSVWVGPSTSGSSTTSSARFPFASSVSCTTSCAGAPFASSASSSMMSSCVGSTSSRPILWYCNETKQVSTVYFEFWRTVMAHFAWNEKPHIHHVPYKIWTENAWGNNTFLAMPLLLRVYIRKTPQELTKKLFF